MEELYKKNLFRCPFCIFIIVIVFYMATEVLTDNIYHTFFTQLGLFGHFAHLLIEALMFYFLLFAPLHRVVQKYNIIEMQYQAKVYDLSKFSHVVNQSADLVMITNREGIIEYVNDAYPNLTGFSKEFFIGNTPSLLKSDEHRKDEYSHLWRTILAGDVYRHVIKNKRKNRSIFYEEKTITPVCLEGNQITHFISTGKDITERIKYEEQLKILATTDSLTSLLNRTRFDEISKREISYAIRYSMPLSFILIDIDFFKKVNDQHGHDVGDSVLIDVAKISMEVLRDTDTLIRWGGEEFLIICPQANAQQAQLLAERLRMIIEKHYFACGKITISGGVAQYNSNESIDQVMKRADNALYYAKNTGRNRISVEQIKNFLVFGE
jgi:diguanylate cyclase (GGDEF)-like protein/PAS domain S-box-containing protein